LRESTLQVKRKTLITNFHVKRYHLMKANQIKTIIPLPEKTR
jgi:hypothetical protein